VKWVAGVCAVMAMAGAGYGDDFQKSFQVFGAAGMDAGEWENYKYFTLGEDFSHQWVQDNYVWVGVKADLHPRLQGVFSVMGWLQYNGFPDSMLYSPSTFASDPITSFNFDHAEAILNLSPNPKDSLVKVEVGLFPFKSNPDSKDLGDYMFRTGCYPGFIDYYGLDLCSQLGGIHVSNDMCEGWHNDFFLTSELHLYPYNDFSLTYLTDFKPFSNNMLDFGAGVQLYRCFSVDNGLTQPKVNPIGDGPAGGVGDLAPNYYFLESDPFHKDTLFYTYAGTKIQARIAFDPKPLLGDVPLLGDMRNVLGQEDLKLYGEAIILGVKNYPADYEFAQNTSTPINEFGYDKLMQKMPIMMGMNLPAFKIFNLLSVEAEYYGKDYVNTVPTPATGNLMTRLPLPYDPNVNSGLPYGDPGEIGSTGEYPKSFYYSREAHWKWDLYVKKTLFGNFNVTALAAKDHSRVATNIAQNVDEEEAFVKDGQWYWTLKFGYNF